MAKAFSICSVNLVPYYSKQDVCSSGNRRRAMATNVYADLRSPSYYIQAGATELPGIRKSTIQTSNCGWSMMSLTTLEERINTF